MRGYQGAVRTTNVTTSNAAVELIAGAKGCWLFEVHLSLATAAATVFGLGRPAAKGITPTTPLGLPSLDGDPTELSATTTALAWGTSPTNPSKYMDRVSTSGAIGFVKDWIWANGLFVPSGQTIVVQNILGGGTADIAFRIGEIP